MMRFFVVIYVNKILYMKEDLKMYKEEIINNIKNFTPREDNLKYIHKELDAVVQKNKIAMHIECEVRSGRLMNYLKRDASVIEVPIPSFHDNEELFNESMRISQTIGV